MNQFEVKRIPRPACSFGMALEPTGSDSYFRGGDCPLSHTDGLPGGPVRTVGTYSSSWSLPSKVRLSTISSATSG